MPITNDLPRTSDDGAGAARAPAAGGRVAAADPMRPAPYRVLGNKAQTHDSFTLTLEPLDPTGTLTFAPGQFNMLYVPGAGEAAVSMSGCAGTVRQVEHTVRAVGRVSRLLQRCRRGDVVGLRGPFGTPWPVPLAEGHDVVLVAGGIGLAPLRPALCHMLQHRRRFGRVALLFGARSPGDILFAREIESWRGRFDVEVEVIVDRGDQDWYGLVGVVTNLVPRVQFDPAHTVAFICGPEVMMHFSVRELERRGVPLARCWVSMERNMKCGVGFCGHCQFGPTFVCRDGPVFRYDRVAAWLALREA